MILRYETEKSKMAVKAGMQMINGKVTNYKIRTIGYDTILHTYAIHDDGDRQLIESKRIERKLKY